MSQQTWTETLASARAAATLFNTYTTAKTVINATELVTLPPNWWYVGRKLRVRVSGGISNRVTGPDTTTFQVMMGAIAVFTTGAITLTTTAHTTIPFLFEAELTCRSIGSGTAATLIGQGRVSGIMFQQSGAAAADATNGPTFCVPNTAPAVGTGFDSTISNILDFFVAQSFSGAGNGIQVHQYEAESLN